MIEKRYTGIAKQGADVVANPTLDGSEQALNSIQINGENFKIEGGGGDKLKLVAERENYDYQEDNYLSLVYEFERIELQKNKTYLVRIITHYDDDLEDFSSSCIFSLQEKTKYNQEIRVPIIVRKNDSSMFGEFYLRTYGDSKGFLVSISTPDMVEQLNGKYTLQIYELEFGGSSGGGTSGDELLDINKFKMLESSEFTLVDNRIEITLTSDSQIGSLPSGIDYSKIKVNLNGYKLVFTLYQNIDLTLTNGQEYINNGTIYNYSRYDILSKLDEADNAHLNFPPTDENVSLLVEFNNKSNVWIFKEILTVDI